MVQLVVCYELRAGGEIVVCYESESCLVRLWCVF